MRVFRLSLWAIGVPLYTAFPGIYNEDFVEIQ